MCTTSSRDGHTAAQVYDDLDDRQRADRIDDICDSLSEENVPPDALAPIRAYAGWLRDGVSAGENECDAAALLREFEQLPVRRLTDQTVVMERSPLDGWRARCGQAVKSAASTCPKCGQPSSSTICVVCGWPAK